MLKPLQYWGEWLGASVNVLSERQGGKPRKKKQNFMSLYMTDWAIAIKATQYVTAGDRTSDLQI